MDFLNNIGINSPSGYFGAVLLVIGGFMVLAGVGIISIQQVTIRQGRATWVVGALLAVVGAFLLYPDFSNPDAVGDSPAAVVDENPAAVADVNPTAAEDENPAAPPTTIAPNGKLSEWKTIKFTIPGNGLWLEQDGSFKATGSKDTIAWSEDLFEGDVEFSLDIESSNSYSAANIIFYGNGGSLALGNLIFVIAGDQQSILTDTIYDGGTYLYSSLNSLEFGEQKHSVLISIHDRRASLFLDGEEIASAFLDDSINASGKIGLLKWGGINNVTFSNIRVRSMEPGG